MASENCALIKQLVEYLINYDIEKALQLTNDPAFEKCYYDCCWDLIPAVSKCLNEDTFSRNKNLFNLCEELMEKIAVRSPPEECLLLVIDEIETLDDITFNALLLPMQKILLRIKSKVGQSVEWGFNSIYRHLLSLSLPEESDLEGEERKLLDCDPNVQRIAELYSIVIPFYEPFIVMLESNDSDVDEKNKIDLKEATISSLYRLLGRPLLFMDLEYDGKMKSSLRVSSEKIIQMISRVQPNLLSAFFWQDLSNIVKDINKSHDDFNRDDHVPDSFSTEDKFSPVTLGVYCYLIFGEGIKLSEIPHILNPLFILNTNLYLSTLLLKAPLSLVQIKGLYLVKGTLERFCESSIPCEELQAPFYTYLIDGFFTVAVYCSVKENRELSVKLIKQLILTFDLDGRYLLLLKMVKLANHSGIIGFLATLYKDVLFDVLNKSIEDTKFFSEKKILRLLDLFCNLPQKAESDLIELSDQIISSLNLLRFIILGDKTNRTGIQHHINHLNVQFLGPLEEGINLSRAHYKQKLKDIEEERLSSSSTSKAKFSSTPIFIGKNKVPNLPFVEKVNLITSALNTFDVIESLLCRVRECIN